VGLRVAHVNKSEINTVKKMHTRAHRS